MKKRVLFIAAIAIAAISTNDVNAQDFKPEAGAKNIEVNFTPMGNSPISINNLRFRYFKSSDMAFRVGLSVRNNSTTSLEEVSDGTADGMLELEDKESTFGFGINLGFEKHWGGTDRLSPYWGAELGFSSLSTTDTDQSQDPTDATASYESETTGGSTTFGLNLVLGADYYFAKSFYLGTEVGFGFTSTSEKDEETTNPGGPDTDKVTSPGGSSFALGENFNSAIRLGFIF